MTELDRLIAAHIVKRLESEPLSSEDIERLTVTYRAGFLACRKLASDELKYLGSYAQARNIQLGSFIEARYLKVTALGDTEADLSN